MQASYETKGGAFGHISRRFIHVAIIFIPLIYYHWFLKITSSVAFAHHIIILAMLAVVIAEVLRLKFQLVLFAQRSHEQSHVSSFAWTMISVGFVLLLAPKASYAVAIVACCAIVDPLMGELKIKIGKSVGLFLIGLLAALLIWIFCMAHYHESIWIAFLIAPITIACEWPVLKWIDDNALMMLVPLIMVLAL